MIGECRRKIWSGGAFTFWNADCGFGIAGKDERRTFTLLNCLMGNVLHLCSMELKGQQVLREISSKDLSSIRKIFKQSAQILFNRVNAQHRMERR